jgi:hypothetical protein
MKRESPRSRGRRESKQHNMVGVRVCVRERETERGRERERGRGREREGGRERYFGDNDWFSLGLLGLPGKGKLAFWHVWLLGDQLLILVSHGLDLPHGIQIKIKLPKMDP